MKSKVLTIIVFILSIICLVISAKMMLSLGVFVDEFNTSPDIVYGGYGYLDMLNIGFLLFICILSGINIFFKTK